MKVFQKEISFRTKGHGDIHDLTPYVDTIIRESGILTGLAHLFNVGSTGALGTIEIEPGLEKDLPALLDRLIPPGRGYAHEQTWHDGNGHSHLQATLLSPSITIPFQDAQLLLGTWQQLFHLECDIKPRSRKIIVTLQGD